MAYSLGKLKKKKFEVEERGIEQRAHPRVSIAVPMHIRLPNLDAVFSSDALDISKSGMFLTMASPPAVGTKIDVDLSLQDGGLILHATVEVVRRIDKGSSTGVGVRFVDISYEAQALIDRMLADEQLFGDYRLEALIGRGGMAEVYRALELSREHAGRLVALKRIIPELVEDLAITDLFAREGIVSRAVKHPNIVEVYDVGEVGHTYYIAMEYIDGCNLEQLIDSCRLRRIAIPIDVACYICKTVAEALHHAHTACDADGKPLGIVHRDVTPANIFLSKEGDIKLGDFGVALAAGLGGEKPGTQIAGKDPYMAPEQLVGASVSPASDIFSLGAVLFEALTGKRAFEGSNSQEIYKQLRGGALRTAKTLRPKISDDLDRVIVQALSPLPPGLGGGLRAKLHAWKHRDTPERFGDAASFAAAVTPLYDAAIGTRLAISAMVHILFSEAPPAA
ncbi:MAG: protein kinase [Myxococcota bacterium]